MRNHSITILSQATDWTAGRLVCTRKERWDAARLVGVAVNPLQDRGALNLGNGFLSQWRMDQVCCGPSGGLGVLPLVRGQHRSVVGLNTTDDPKWLLGPASMGDSAKPHLSGAASLLVTSTLISLPVLPRCNTSTNAFRKCWPGDPRILTSALEAPRCNCDAKGDGDLDACMEHTVSKKLKQTCGFKEGCWSPWQIADGLKISKEVFANLDAFKACLLNEINSYQPLSVSK
eukprot:1774504-Amphidinium_carterae.1